MGLNRRKVVQLGTAAAVGTVIPRLAVGSADPNTAFEAEFDATLQRLRNIFAGLGFSESQPLSIVTANSDYNGGLRHDFDQSVLPAKAFVIQPLARVADVGEKARTDILPLFHEVGCHPGQDVNGQDMTRLMMGILIGEFGLDPARIAFVSVPQSTDMSPVLDELGMPFPEKVLLRNEKEALAARDASGYFFPDPFGDDYSVTMGVYYRIGNTDEAAPATYPPSADWTEIGEIVISGDAAPLGLSIGAERLTYALTGQFPTWDQRLGALFAKAEQDSIGGVQPSGIATFK